jgi:hypothetical protein
VVGSSESYNDPAGSVGDRKCLHNLSDYKLLTEGSTAWN